jgi:hypothetical protein
MIRINNVWHQLLDNVEDFEGFVYKVTEIDTKKFYIGKKAFWKIRKLKPLKGKINGRNKKVETDWKTYNTSNKYLQEKMKQNPENYSLEIISLCKNKTERALKETYYQINEYLTGNWKDMYNECINMRVRIRK